MFGAFLRGLVSLSRLRPTLCLPLLRTVTFVLFFICERLARRLYPYPYKPMLMLMPGRALLLLQLGGAGEAAL